MQNNSNPSNAVLTPHLNHSNFSRGKYAHRANYRKWKNTTEVTKPLTQCEKASRIKWQLQQISIIKNIPSNAVLGA